MDSAEDGDKGLNVEEPHSALVKSKSKVQHGVTTGQTKSSPEGLEPQQESRQGATSFCSEEWSETKGWSGKALSVGKKPRTHLHRFVPNGS